MQTSKKGIDFILRWEKFMAKPYLCPAGVWTIGYGTTILNGKKVDASTPAISESKARAVAEEQIKNQFEPGVSRYLSTYKFSQSEFDALVSFHYNTGKIAMMTRNGTRTKEQIAQKFKEYNLANGRRSNGLVRRRQQEEDIFRKGIYASS